MVTSNICASVSEARCTQGQSPGLCFRRAFSQHPIYTRHIYLPRSYFDLFCNQVFICRQPQHTNSCEHYEIFSTSTLEKLTFNCLPRESEEKLMTLLGLIWSVVYLQSCGVCLRDLAIYALLYCCCFSPT